MAKKTWNDRNQRNYDRYFADKYDKPTSRSTPTYSENRHNKSYRESTQRSAPNYGRRRMSKPKRIIWVIASAVIVLAFVIVLSVVGRKTGNGTYVSNAGGTSITSTYSFSDNKPSSSTCIVDSKSIPEYQGYLYGVINNGKPNFTEWDYNNIEGQNLSKLDKYGRCQTAVAMLDRSMMPTEERGYIGNIKPTGWVQNKYFGVVDSEPPYLYNRCHLIAYALTGENANEQNLITGTRYMNVNGMLSWEEQVMRYLDTSPNHVLYRVTPYYDGKEMLARGVEMEAYSVEDDGQGVCFHVFIYNVQPGVSIDYSTGENWLSK